MDGPPLPHPQTSSLCINEVPATEKGRCQEAGIGGGGQVGGELFQSALGLLVSQPDCRSGGGRCETGVLPRSPFLWSGPALPLGSPRPPTQTQKFSG